MDKVLKASMVSLFVYNVVDFVFLFFINDDRRWMIGGSSLGPGMP
jgi:hypothetical protein